MDKRVMRWAMSLTIAGTCGCVAPTSVQSHRDDGLHARVDDAVLACLREGESNRADVARWVGRRDVELAGGRLWVYSWGTRNEIGYTWFAAVPFGALLPLAGDGTVETSQMHYLLVEFDEWGRVTRKRVKHGGVINGLATGLDDAMIEEE